MDSNPKVIQTFIDLLDKYDHFIFDCDGVLWDHSQKFGKAFKALNLLKEKGKSVFFLTNSGKLPRKSVQKKISEYGFESPVECIYTASYIVPAYLKIHHPEVKKVYLIGMLGLIEELTEAGFDIVGGTEHDESKIKDKKEILQMPLENDIDAVVVGFDTNFNYYKLVYASACIQKGAQFFMSCDESYGIVCGMKYPIVGTFLAAIETCTGKSPLVLGKPNKYCVETIIEQHKLSKEKCLIVGDRIDTDILAGKRAGIDTCLVLSGVYTQEMLDVNLKLDDPITPNYVCRAVCID